mmetsp:Transcript_46634/g.92784  ORF Transcript_46634/g.92784 Transcript_46634/m.92784 type:complete len:236 (-) Transcript_46634:91-798(-)
MITGCCSIFREEPTTLKTADAPKPGKVSNRIYATGEGEEEAPTNLDNELVAKLHSAVRWNKPTGEITALAKKAGISTKQAARATDTKNGNQCLHIAAQNDHLHLVQFLVAKKADVNAQNAKGQAPLHMSVQYDLYQVSKFLLASGADEKRKNADGHEAIFGIDGDKRDGEAWDSPLTMLKCASDKEEVDAAFDAFERADLSIFDKASIAQTGLQKKKDCAQFWDHPRFVDLMRKL